MHCGIYHIFCLVTLVSVQSTKQLFPWGEFLHANEDHEHLIEPSHLNISEEYLCSHNGKCCSCKKDCWQTQSCCIDILWGENNTNINNYQQTMLKAASKYPFTQCLPVYMHAKKLGFEADYIQMIATCKNSIPVDLVRNCLNPELNTSAYSVPVMDEDKHIYKNSFCAMCNGIEKYKMIDIRVECNSTSTENPYNVTDDVFNKAWKCKFRAPLTSPGVIECYDMPNTKGTCHKSSRYYELCNSYKGVVFVNNNSTGTKQYFHNYHCYMCDGVENDDDLMFTCKNYGTLGSGFWAYTISFQLNDRRRCLHDEIFNVITNQCEKECDQGYDLIGNTCVKKIHVTEPTYMNCLLAETPTLYIQFKNQITPLHSEIEEIKDFIVKKSIVITKYSSISAQIEMQSSTNITSLLSALRNSSLQLWSTAKYVLITSNKLTHTQLYGMSMLYPGQRMCARPWSITKPDIKLTSNCSYLNGNVTIATHDTVKWINFTQYNESKNMQFCSEYHLASSCQKKTLTRGFQFRGNKIKINGTNKWYNASFYLPNDVGISICIDNRERDIPEIYEDLQYYITVICMPISLTCYVIILVTHLYFKNLQNMPGLILIGLCFVLLCTDSVVFINIFVDASGVVCKIIAIFLHWGLLSAQCWMIVVAFDLCSKFGWFSTGVPINKKKYITYYTLFATLFPVLIVVTLVTLQSTNTFDVKYGEDDICFITDKYARLYFYIIPVSMVTVLTSCSVIFTLVSIHRKQVESKKVLKQNSFKLTTLLHIALKLVAVLGLIEIVGFISIQKDDLSYNEKIFNAIFAVIYTFLRSLKGVVLFLIYMVRKEKRKLIMDKLTASFAWETQHSSAVIKNSTAM